MLQETETLNLITFLFCIYVYILIIKSQRKKVFKAILLPCMHVGKASFVTNCTSRSSYSPKRITWVQGTGSGRFLLMEDKQITIEEIRRSQKACGESFWISEMFTLLGQILGISGKPFCCYTRQDYLRIYSLKHFVVYLLWCDKDILY